MNKRSTEKELIDLGPSFYTFEEYAACLKILFTINQWMGFFKTTVRLLADGPDSQSVVDVGCGGGLLVLNLSQFYPKMTLLGLDTSEMAIRLANEELGRWMDNNPNLRVAFERQEHAVLALERDSVDVVLATLVCHHIDDDDLIIFLQTAYRAARRAVIINDLHRHPLAYWFYKSFSKLLFRNRLITHDGLISIQKGFTRAELEHLLQRANISQYTIKWHFPFRWSIVLWKK